MRGCRLCRSSRMAALSAAAARRPQVAAVRRGRARGTVAVAGVSTPTRAGAGPRPRRAGNAALLGRPRRDDARAGGCSIVSSAARSVETILHDCAPSPSRLACGGMNARRSIALDRRTVDARPRVTATTTSPPRSGGRRSRRADAPPRRRRCRAAQQLSRPDRDGSFGGCVARAPVLTGPWCRPAPAAFRGWRRGHRGGPEQPCDADRRMVEAPRIAVAGPNASARRSPAARIGTARPSLFRVRAPPQCEQRVWYSRGSAQPWAAIWRGAPSLLPNQAMYRRSQESR